MSLYAGLGLGFDDVKPGQPAKAVPVVEAESSVALALPAAAGTTGASTGAATSAPAAEGWSSSRGLMMSATLKRKRVAEMAAKASGGGPGPKRRPPNSAAAAAAALGAVMVTDMRASATGNMGSVAVLDQQSLEAGPQKSASQGEEYDPFHPNDYDECLTRKMEQEDMARAARAFEREQERRRRRRHRDDDSDGTSADSADGSHHTGDDDEDGSRGGGADYGAGAGWRLPGQPAVSRNSAAIAPPPSVLTGTSIAGPTEVAPASLPGNHMQALFGQSGDEAFLARARLSQPSYNAPVHHYAPPKMSQPPPPVPQPPPPPPPLLFSSHASMGQSGEPNDAPPPLTDGPPGLEHAVFDDDAEYVQGPVDSSAVVLLTNLVAPGQVDNELGPETAEECKKYGNVLQCVVRELPAGPGMPAEDSVRVFVQFSSINSAVKAVSDMNGRLFGGRVVKAALYDRRRFLLGNFG